MKYGNCQVGEAEKMLCLYDFCEDKNDFDALAKKTIHIKSYKSMSYIGFLNHGGRENTEVHRGGVWVCCLSFTVALAAPLRTLRETSLNHGGRENTKVHRGQQFLVCRLTFLVAPRRSSAHAA
ncbi:MAG: hypothetical protein BGP14_08880 [Sphingobacteriales bacterium 44-15]|nr:MAG: hypothetical protein BGP14_08880 [Sphingobacteriales bacterium 44-15]